MSGEVEVSSEVEVRCAVNGAPVHGRVEPRRLLVDFLREQLDLTGTHIGCEHGVCGACTVLLDGEPVRSCLLFAVQADGCEITTVEGLTPPGGLSRLQEAFRAHHALQCGFCTPGMLTTVQAFLSDNPRPTAAQVREAISGNLCRCTGYVPIVAAVLDAAGVSEGHRHGD